MTLDESERDQLKKRFNGAMVGIYERAKAQTGYNARFFIDMVEERGGYGTATYLLNKQEQSSGFTELYLRKRLDLTVEHLVLQLEWRQLFTMEELAIAQQRLDELHFPLAAELRVEIPKGRRARRSRDVIS